MNIQNITIGDSLPILALPITARLIVSGAIALKTLKMYITTKPRLTARELLIFL